MKHHLYTFVGSATALHHYITQSTASDQAAALAACNQLTGVSTSLLDAAGTDTSEETFKELFSTHAVTVLEAVETLRQTSVYQTLNETITALLEYFYNAADALFGGGGDPPWPSLTSLFR